MKKVIYGCLIASVIGGCGILDKEPLDIDGERISVIREDKNLKPEYLPGQMKVRLPKAMVNHSWTQDGATSEHLVGHLKAGGNLDEIWTTSFGEGSSKRNVLISKPVTNGRQVFTVDADGVARSFDLETGDEIWKKRLKHSNKEAKESSLTGGGVAVHRGTVFATTGFGKVFAISAIDGSIVWEQDIKSPIRIAPTVADDLIIVQTLDNGIYAMNVKSGKILWKDKIEAESTTMVGGASPAYSPANDLVVAAFSNGQLQAYKASTGTPLWSEWLVSGSATESLSDITAVKANPIIDSEAVYAVGYNTPLVAVETRTGVKLWQKDIAASSQPWIAGKFMFVLTTDGDLVALDKTNGKIIWTAIIPYNSDEDKLGIFTSGPLLANDALLVASSNGKLFSVSPYNGRIMGVADIEEGVETTPILVNETLILTTNDAEMTAYK